MSSLSKAANSSAKWAAVAIGFSVPISVALDNMLMLAVLLLWLAGGHFKEKYEAIAKRPVSLAALALIGMLIVGMLYGNSPFKEALDAFGKYIDLLFVPIFITIFRDRQARNHALNAFMSAMMLTLFLSYLVKFGLLHQNAIIQGFAQNPYVFKLHITQNFFMSFAAFVLGIWCINETDPKKRVIWGILSLLAVINVLFMVQGRTGYLVVALLLLYLSISRLGGKGLLIGIAATVLLGAAAYYGSSEFRERVDLAASEYAHWHSDHATKNTNSIGQRLEFYANTLEIIRKHPLFGVGTGGFRQAYAAQVADTGMLATHNPHNEFLLIQAQLGIPGTILLLLLLFTQWREAGKLSASGTMLARGLVITMVSGCLFNSFLLDHAEGLFFAFMTGVLFSWRDE